MPTWNYQAVHVYGICRVFNDQESLKAVVENLTTKYESAMKNSWEPSYDPSLPGAIVGVEIFITEIQCKYKSSQNRPAANKERVIAQLAGRGSISMADAMQKI